MVLPYPSSPDRMAFPSYWAVRLFTLTQNDVGPVVSHLGRSPASRVVCRFKTMSSTLEGYSRDKLDIILF